MEPGTRIDSAYFRLTPTRTRLGYVRVFGCYLFITANEKVEKIASGLLDPFLSHLKTVQDQLAKGVYLILLEPEPSSDASWFTKDTVKRFVQFVNTPEVLERVCSIDSEISHIEESIAVQSDKNIGLSTVEDHHEKQVESIEGTDPLDANEGNAIVPYNTGLHLLETNGFAAWESNSKDKILGVLETNKMDLQKEQGMAFARAVAAGYDIDHMESLMSFAKCFGASRLMNACLRFLDLWKGKQETPQLFENEAVKEPASIPHFFSFNASSIMPANVTNDQNESSERWPQYCNDLSLENNGRSCDDARSVSTSSTSCSRDSFHIGNQEYLQGQFPHSIYHPWPIHSPPGALPNFLSYPTQGIPYHQNYMGNSPYFHPSYQSVKVKDLKISAGQRVRQRRHSTDSRGHNTDLDSWNPCTSTTRSQDNSKINKAVTGGKKYRKKASRLGKKYPGLVIRDINYIASKKQNSCPSKSRAASASEIDRDELFQAADIKNTTNLLRCSKKRSHTVSVDISNSSDEEGLIRKKEVDICQWQEFHNCSLKDSNQDLQVIEQNLVAFEKEPKEKRCQIRAIYDLSEPERQDHLETQEEGISRFQDTLPMASMAQVRRLSEPRVSTSQHSLSLTSQTAEAVSKTTPSDETESEKISTIFYLDRILAANLPELIIRIFKGLLDVTQNMPAVKVMPGMVNGTEFCMAHRSSGLNGRNGDRYHDEMSGNPCNVKNVVVLEYEKPAAPTAHASEGMADIPEGHYYNDHAPREKTKLVLEYTAIHAPSSHPIVEGEDGEQIDSQPSSPNVNVTTVYVVKESPTFSSTRTVQEPYQAPYARLSSMDHRCTEKFEYEKAPPSSSEMSITDDECDAPKVILSDFKNPMVERIPKNLKNSLAVQPSKGFRWLLGLVMKNPNTGSGDLSPRLDNSRASCSVARGNAKNTNALIEVHSLKNLASQDEPPTINTSTLKVFRSLPVLSSFGTKSGEKMVA